MQKTQVLASIDLHPDTFQPKNSTQTSLLILQRKTENQVAIEKAAGTKRDYSVFMALADHIGHDKRGNTTYVRDEEGNELAAAKHERIREVRGGAPVVRDVETKTKIIDDNTEAIAGQFRDWLRQQL